jgi:hypothetical protein
VNQPPYNPYQVFGEVVEQVRKALGWPALHFNYDLVEKLQNRLANMGKTPDEAGLKFPLVWLAYGFKQRSGNAAYFSELKNVRVFIITPSTVNAMAPERLTRNFEPTIWPIFWELLRQLNNHPAIVNEPYRRYEWSERFNLGNDQQALFTDVIDCLSIDDLHLQLNHNTNCQPNFKSF